MHYTVLMPMVYTVRSSIGAHIYTLHCANADSTDDDELDRGTCISTHYTKPPQMV